MSAPAHVLVLRPIIERLRERAMEHPTLEEKAWRASEPYTPHPRKRIEAVLSQTT